MSARTAREVVELYNFVVWNERDFALAEELMGDTVIRHDVGEATTQDRQRGFGAVDALDLMPRGLEQLAEGLPDVSVVFDDEEAQPAHVDVRFGTRSDRVRCGRKLDAKPGAPTDTLAVRADVKAV